MSEDFEIELIEDETSEESSFQLPMNFLAVGEVENDDVGVYIKQDVFKALEEYSASDTEHELGSILIGEYSDVMGKKTVVISEYIEAKYTDASASTLTFTHETWDYIHKEHEEKYPEKKILGWQHTHPGYGIFLSNYDLFIQENFFNLPSQVAYVIDPKQGTRGFFQWKNGEVQKLKGYYIYDEVGTPVKVDLSKKETKGEEPEKKQKQLPPFITIALVVVVFILACTVLGMKNKINKQASDYSNLESEIYVQDQEIAALKGAVSQLAANGSGNSASETDYPTVTFIKYTVEAGDTVYKICEKNNIDFDESIEIIKAVNGLRNADLIDVGQTLLLPCSDAE